MSFHSLSTRFDARSGPQGPTISAVDMRSSAPTGITVPHSATYSLGNGNFTLPFYLAADDYTPGSVQWIYYKYQDANNYWGLRINTDGTLQFIAVVASATILSLTSTASISVADGSAIQGAISVTREQSAVAGSSIFIVNGAQLGSSVAITAGTPASISNTGIMYVAGTNSAGSDMTVRGFNTYNRAMTLSGVTSLFSSGVAAADVGASQVPIYTSVFSATTDSWNAGSSNNTITAGVSINGSGNWLEVARITSTGSLTANRAITSSGLRRLTGITIFNPASSGYSYVRITGTGAIANQSDAVIGVPQGTEVSAMLYLAYNSPNSPVVVLACDAAGNAVNVPPSIKMYVKSVQLTVSGNTSLHDPSSIATSPGLTWLDTSGNGNTATLPASGATKTRVQV